MRLILNYKDVLIDKSHRRVIYSKIENFEALTRVKEAIRKDQELNRELGTAHLDTQIKVAEKEAEKAQLYF